MQKGYLANSQPLILWKLLVEKKLFKSQDSKPSPTWNPDDKTFLQENAKHEKKNQKIFAFFQ